MGDSDTCEVEAREGGRDAKADISSGRITYEQFKDACTAFMKLANKLDDPWRMEGDPEVQGDWCLSVAYLRQKTTNRSSTVKEAHSCQLQTLSYRYDIVYSLSHSVPVLYFLISDQSGRSLSLEDLWKMYPVAEKTAMWEVVTQQEHPVLGVPFFFVHPCASSKVLSDCYKPNENFSCVQYLITWLSLVGNSFGLDLSHKYLARILEL